MNWTCWISSDLSGSEEEEGAAILEEREALNLQKKMAAELDDMDFGLEIFKVMIVFNSSLQLFVFWGFYPRFFLFLRFFFFQLYIISYLEKRKGHRTGDKWWKNYKGFVKAFKERKATGEFVCFNLMYMYMYIFWNFNFINRKITSMNYCFVSFCF